MANWHSKQIQIVKNRNYAVFEQENEKQTERIIIILTKFNLIPNPIPCAHNMERNVQHRNKQTELEARSVEN